MQKGIVGTLLILSHTLCSMEGSSTAISSERLSEFEEQTAQSRASSRPFIEEKLSEEEERVPSLMKLALESYAGSSHIKDLVAELKDALLQDKNKTFKDAFKILEERVSLPGEVFDKLIPYIIKTPVGLDGDSLIHWAIKVNRPKSEVAYLLSLYHNIHLFNKKGLTVAQAIFIKAINEGIIEVIKAEVKNLESSNDPELSEQIKWLRAVVLYLEFGQEEDEQVFLEGAPNGKRIGKKIWNALEKVCAPYGLFLRNFITAESSLHDEFDPSESDTYPRLGRFFLNSPIMPRSIMNFVSASPEYAVVNRFMNLFGKEEVFNLPQDKLSSLSKKEIEILNYLIFDWDWHRIRAFLNEDRGYHKIKLSNLLAAAVQNDRRQLVNYLINIKVNFNEFERESENLIFRGILSEATDYIFPHVKFNMEIGEYSDLTPLGLLITTISYNDVQTSWGTHFIKRLIKKGAHLFIDAGNDDSDLSGFFAWYYPNKLGVWLLPFYYMITLNKKEIVLFLKKYPLRELSREALMGDLYNAVKSHALPREMLLDIFKFFKEMEFPQTAYEEDAEVRITFSQELFDTLYPALFKQA